MRTNPSDAAEPVGVPPVLHCVERGAALLFLLG
jgi:hypothetical protein